MGGDTAHRPCSVCTAIGLITAPHILYRGPHQDGGVRWLDF
jgi:hypothetical protein